MFSTILGWILVVLGVITYLVALAMLIKERFFPAKPAARELPVFKNLDFKEIANFLEKVSDLIETFSKLSVPVQWAFLGLVTIGIGAYLIANAPF
jgi:hypothetical protein